LMLVKRVEEAGYNELAEVALPNGEIRRCKVLEIDGDTAIVQLFDTDAGISIAESKIRFLGRGLELAVSEDMLGRAFDDLAKIERKSAEPVNAQAVPVISARQLSVNRGVKPFDLDIHKGEVVGLAGLLGSGRTEVARVIFGADAPDTGTLEVSGVKARHNPLASIRTGMAFCPEDRKLEGSIQELTVRDNIVLAAQTKKGAFHLIPRAEQDKIAQKYVDLLQIKVPSLDTPIKQLSGGNQQKVIVARWLATDPDLLILDEPTRGIDVGTKTEIQKLCIELADGGMAVLFISSEIDEMLRACDRMEIMRDLSMVGELAGSQMSTSAIMSKIAGDDAEEVAKDA
ncbi:MAG: ATP-binding cassette domain-containing protein, partial [Micrococcales bacterium]|nr:ATP-binding cassette domain-containing protein [Micrococcales bacterium]